MNAAKVLKDFEIWLKIEQYDTSTDEFYIRAIQAAEKKLEELKKKIQ